MDYNFLNEVKINELKVGTRVIMKGPKMKKFKEPTHGIILDLEDRMATVAKIGKKRDNYGHMINIITLTLDDPIAIKIDLYTKSGKKADMQMDAQISDIKVDKNKFQYFDIVTPEYLELQKKLKDGDIVKFHATKDFLSLLKDIKFKMKGEFFDISYFDVIKDSPDYVSFIPAKKSTGEDFEKFRQQSKIGKIFRKLNPDLKDTEIEDYVNKYKAELEIMMKGPEINVVTGEEISYWYHQKRYESGGGSLNNSCMRFANEQKSVRFYDNFPDKIALAIYTKGGKLLARALIWRLDDGKIYMDRVYSVNAIVGIHLDKYAANFKMMTYKKRGSNKKMYVTLQSKKKMEMNIPYFDTFACLDINKKDKKEDIYITKLVGNY
jgi:hypothetical protein